jgi:ABC-2 type transport system permease protein
LLSVLDKGAAIVRRDLLTARRSRGGILFQAAGVLAEVAAFYYLSRAVGDHYSADGMQYYAFLLTGTALFSFLTIATTVFVDSIRDAQLSGTMEVLMSLNTRGSVIVALGAGSIFAGRLIHLVLYIAAGLFLFPVGKVLHANIPATLLIVALSVLVTFGLGMLLSAVQVLTQRGSALAWLVGAVTSVISGVLYPISALPEFLQKAAAVNPFTHALIAFRLAAVQGEPLQQMQQPVVILTIYAVLLVLAGFFALNASLRSARKLGILSLY